MIFFLMSNKNISIKLLARPAGKKLLAHIESRQIYKNIYL